MTNMPCGMLNSELHVSVLGRLAIHTDTATNEVIRLLLLLVKRESSGLVAFFMAQGAAQCE